MINRHALGKPVEILMVEDNPGARLGAEREGATEGLDAVAHDVETDPSSGERGRRRLGREAGPRHQQQRLLVAQGAELALADEPSRSKRL